MYLPTSLPAVVLSAALCTNAEPISQHPLFAFSDPDHVPSSTNAISSSLFSSLERLARLVDISYCVGTSGISAPFSCASRCKDFPNLELASTWNTGVLMSDSCGYVAVDHGAVGPDSGSGSKITATKDMREGNKDNHDAPAIIVAFRGTYSITNTVIDLSTVPQEYVPYPEPGEGGGNKKDHEEHKCTNCTVHMGFMESWKQARKLVLPVLKNVKARYPDYPIQLVGHSLGGAVACLAALELKLAMGWDNLVVTTFGEPQAGNAGFASFVDRVFQLEEDDTHRENPEKNTYRRVTHAEDPVPLLPLSEWGYRPHAGEIYITKRDLSPGTEDLRICQGDEDISCISGGDGSNKGALGTIPSRLKLWQLLFAHRDYFWRLGLCLPGGDPFDWGRPPYHVGSPNEL